jgi:hypothetical protein
VSAVTVAVIGGGAALIGAGIQASAAESAAQTQANALENAQGIQEQMFQQVQQNEAPFLQAGQGAISQLNYLLGTGNPNGSSSAGGFGSLNAPFTAQTFQSMSPAYQFQLQQGRQGVLNQDASQQGAESGAAMKDLISFNQGMANTSFNNAFNQYQTQQTNTFNRLAGIAGMGQQAGSASATGAPQFAQSIGQTASNIGTAEAAGQVGVANAVSGGLQGATGYYNMSQALPWLMQNQQANNPYYSQVGNANAMGITEPGE